MPDKTENLKDGLEPPPPIIIKESAVGTQAEKLVRVRREAELEESLTILEKLEAEGRRLAEEIITSAKDEAEQIILKAESEAKGIRNNAYEEGTLNSKRDVLSHVSGMLGEMEGEIKSLRSIRADFQNSNLPGIIDFSCALAEQVLLVELETRPELVLERLKTLIDRMPSKVNLTISIPEKEMEALRSHLSELNIEGADITKALKADSSLTPGSIKLTSDDGCIEAPLLESLGNIRELLINQAETIRLSNQAPGETG